MNTRTVSNPRVYVDHPRRPAPSRASLHVTIDWLKGGHLAECELTEDQLVDLAAEALKAVIILRNNRDRL